MIKIPGLGTKSYSMDLKMQARMAEKLDARLGATTFVLSKIMEGEGQETKKFAVDQIRILLKSRYSTSKIHHEPSDRYWHIFNSELEKWAKNLKKGISHDLCSNRA